MHNPQPVRQPEGPGELGRGIPQIIRIHAVRLYRPGAWDCQACEFLGDLHAAIRHVVELQWRHSFG